MVISPAKQRGGPAPAPTPVTITYLGHPLAYAHAFKLAGRDPSRLRPLADGSVLVVNARP